jgi:MoxR-like ATPase
MEATVSAYAEMKRPELIATCKAKWPELDGRLFFDLSVNELRGALESGILPEKTQHWHAVKQDNQPKAEGSEVAGVDSELLAIANVLRTLKGSGATVDAEQVNARLVDMLVPNKLEVIQKDKPKVETGDVHFMFKDVLEHVAAGDWCYLYGPAGSGKTTLAENVADSLSRPFATQSCFGAISGTVFNGYMDANGNYVATNFRRIYENGGVFILDEVDAAPSEILLVLNAALSNCYHAFPDGMIKRHADFVCIACANTVGNGATIEYNGRNALDRAFLDRFSRLQFPYDEAFETRLAIANWPEQPAAAKAWAERVQKIRKAAESIKARICVSPRATITGAKLLRAGMSQDKIEQRRIWAEVTDEVRTKIIAAIGR